MKRLIRQLAQMSPAVNLLTESKHDWHLWPFLEINWVVVQSPLGVVLHTAL